MTKKETIKILAMLSAFYGQGKSDAETMANAWHLILKDFDYTLAERAVVQFVRNDNRDYASFPPPGVIVDRIEYQHTVYGAAVNMAFNKVEYSKLELRYRQLIPKDAYNKLLLMDSEVVKANKKDLMTELIHESQKLLEKNPYG